LKPRLAQMNQECPSAWIKNPACWKNVEAKRYTTSDAYHLSQWRDYIFEE